MSKWTHQYSNNCFKYLYCYKAYRHIIAVVILVSFIPTNSYIIIYNYI